VAKAIGIGLGGLGGGAFSSWFARVNGCNNALLQDKAIRDNLAASPPLVI
jgi:hypothetical protein